MSQSTRLSDQQLLAAIDEAEEKCYTLRCTFHDLNEDLNRALDRLSRLREQNNQLRSQIWDVKRRCVEQGFPPYPEP